MAFLDIKNALLALNAQLKKLNKKFEIVVCGGSALSEIGLIQRTTKDVDVLGFIERKDDEFEIVRADFPDWLNEIISKIARDLNIPQNWMNSGPTSIVDLGLPDGFENRLMKKNYGEYLTVYYISRIDQIYFKLYASVDRGGYHVEDLKKLKPSAEEIENAARWSMTHDVSDGYREILKDFLERMGYYDVARKI